MNTSSINRVPLFATLPETEKNNIIKQGTHCKVAKRKQILSEGDAADTLYILLRGQAKVFRSDDSGREIILNTLESGDYFGELGLLDDVQRSASVTAISDCELLCLNKETFSELLGRYPDIAKTLLRDMARRIRDLTDSVESLALQNVYARVANTLMNLAEPHGDQWLVREKMTQQDIANRVGASREMISRILKELSIGGYIDYHRRQITIKKRLPKDF